MVPATVRVNHMLDLSEALVRCFQAVYNATKAFVDSFSLALPRAHGHRRHRELPDAGRYRHSFL